MMDHWPLNCVLDILAELEWVCLKYALSNKRKDCQRSRRKRTLLTTFRLHVKLKRLIKAYVAKDFSSRRGALLTPLPVQQSLPSYFYSRCTGALSLHINLKYLTYYLVIWMPLQTYRKLLKRVYQTGRSRETGLMFVNAVYHVPARRLESCR